MKTILIVEDDHLQADWLHGILEEHFPQAEIRWIQTEVEFQNAINGLRKEPPDLVLLDVMLRWTDPAPNMIVPPKEIRDNGGFFRAGFRCERMLRQHEETKNVPVILYTVLEEYDFRENDLGIDLQNLPLNTFYVGKDSDPTELLEAIRMIGG